MKIVVIGANGQVGYEFTKLASSSQVNEDIECKPFSSSELDIMQPWALYATLQHLNCDYVVNAAAYTAVDVAEECREQCLNVNKIGVQNLAKACQSLGIPLIHISTDYVFDGKKNSPYIESDKVSPINFYGESKSAGEDVLRQILPEHIILRVSWVFSDRRSNFIKSMVALSSEKEELRIVSDQVGAPTSAFDIARVLLAMIKQLHCGAALWGTYHYCSLGSTNWYDFSKKIIHEVSLYKPIKVRNVVAIKTAEYNYKAKRPLNSGMNCQKIRDTFGIHQRPWLPGMQRVVKKLCNPEVGLLAD